jgi:hypothetical protein
MTTCSLINGQYLKVYSNKSHEVFKKGAELAMRELNMSGVYGFVYDDFNPNMEIVEKWQKEEPNMKIFYVATRAKTVMLDCKLRFYKYMKGSIYVPESYLSYDEVVQPKDENEIYFVKRFDSSCSRHVNVYTYKDLKNVDTTECIIQKSMINPDLYKNKRYKIRFHVLVYKGNLYYCKHHFATVSDEDYSTSKKLRNTHVIHQTAKTLFILSSEIDGYEKIEEEILLCIQDFKVRYGKEMSEIKENEYAILGFDIVVDTDKKIHLIEINHRANYSHPAQVGDKTDVLCMKDLMKLMINDTHDGTDLLML